METVRTSRRRLQVAVAGVLAFSVCGSASAFDPIRINPDGIGGDPSFMMNNLDWAPGNALGINANDITMPNNIELAAHSDLSAFDGAPGGSAPGLGVNYEWTFSTAFPEFQSAGVLVPDSDGDGINEGQSVNFGLGAGMHNFIEIYYDTALNADPLTGLGYDDGQLILQAEVVTVIGGFQGWNEVPNTSTTNTGPGVTLNNMNVGLATATTNPSLEGNTGADGYNLLDNFGPDNLGGQQTLSGQGTTIIGADVTWYDPAFFMNDISSFLIDMVTSTFNNHPFFQANPSSGFDNLPGTNATNVVPNLGTVNGLGVLSGINFGAYGFSIGTDVQFQTDSTTAFNRTIPAPGVVALLSAGLIGIGAVRRRKLAA